MPGIVDLVYLTESEVLDRIERQLDVVSAREVELVAANVQLVEVVGGGEYEVITEPKSVFEILTMCMQGPPGPASGEDEVKYAERVDFVGSTLIYRAEAAPGTPESAPAWRIYRLELGAGGDVTTTWAGGTSAFDKAWSNRASEVYS